MKSILDPVYRPVLQKFLKDNTLMAFDYDGTLAPIVDDPHCAKMRPRTRELLRRVATRYSTVVITGRKRAETLQLMDGVPLLEVIGNHGAESRGTRPSHTIQQVADWRRELEKSLGSLEGVVLEDKRYSLSIHYRQSPEKDVTHKIMQATENLQGARRIGGKSVFNIVSTEVPGKGAALLRLCERFGTPGAVFVGDDETDEDVFGMEMPEKILGIRVGEKGGTAAHYYLKDQTDIDQLLEAMTG